MMNEEQRRQIVLEAIKEVTDVYNPEDEVKNQTWLYEVAMRAVEMATSNDAKQTLIKKQMMDRYEFVKKQYNPIYAEVEVTFKDEMGGNDVSRTEIIKLTDNVMEKEDGHIFFYCMDFDELLKLTEPNNGEDFVITAFNDFYETL